MALDRLHQAYRDREAWGRACHAAGRRVVGVLAATVPTELILAAGLCPVLLTGTPGRATPFADRYLEPVFDGAIRSLFDRIVSGDFDFVDLIVIPRSSEGLLQLYYMLQQMPRWEPARPLPDIVLLDLLQTPYWLSGRYNLARLADLAVRLGTLAGRPIGDDDLRAAIALCNRTRRLVADINDLRRAHPPRLSGTDMLAVMGATMALDPLAFHAAAEDLLATPVSRPLPGPRLMVKGMAQDTTSLYGLIETRGAVVVADDHAFGERPFAGPVPEADDPLEALTSHCQLHVPSVRTTPQSAEDDRFMALVEAADVEGVVFVIEANDDTFGWDYPGQKRRLDARGIPSVLLARQSYDAPNDSARAAAIEGLLAAVTRHGEAREAVAS